MNERMKRFFRYGLLAVFAYALFLFACRILACYELPENVDRSRLSYGTAWAPYSDALGPWLHGTVYYYFYNMPLSYLYRPTVGIFNASILSIFGGIQWIPLFFEGWLVVSLAAIFLLADEGMRLVLTAWVMVTALAFKTLGEQLAPATLMIDFPSYILTICGLLLLTVSLKRKERSALGIMGAFLLIGISATIRGPLMLAGPGLLVLSFFLLRGQKRIGLLCGAALLFFLPIFIDGFIQKQYNLTNNGFNNLYCFYSEPTHYWTSACFDRYIKEKPSHAEVLQQYAEFLFSPDGMKVLFETLQKRLELDFAFFVNEIYVETSAYIALISLMLVASGGLQLRQKLLHCCSILMLGSWLWWLHYLTQHDTASIYLAALALVAYLAVASFVTRAKHTPVMLTAYVLGLTFLGLLGLAVNFERLNLSFSFAIYLAPLLFLAESATRKLSDNEEFSRPSPALFALCNAAIVLALYSANGLVDTQAKRNFREKVDKHPAAIKITNDIRLDRSLYLSGLQALVYTQYDPAPFGTPIFYELKDQPNKCCNASFIDPFYFKQIPEPETPVIVP